MCGIVGIVTKRGNPPDEGVLRRMSEAVAHRGPDANGEWVRPGVGLAQRRLAIIDLSPAGAQPMEAVEGDCAIVLNGEIYNFKELRAELEATGAKFRSRSDTEVVLEAYRAWGTSCVKRLRGMFAFAIWDIPRKRLFVARDRIGKKPLFYAMTQEGDLAFASEVKALVPAVVLRPDWDAVRLFLGLQYVPSPRTGFEGVFQFLPGTFGVYESGVWKMESYHDWNSIQVDTTWTEERAIGALRQKLEESVRIRQLTADVPVGAFLSGGVDSAAVVAFASKQTTKFQTFTMGFPNLHMDERREARMTADYFKTDHFEFEAKPADLVALADDIVRHYDAPYADSSALPLWLLSKKTAKEIKVVLTGDGGDELFGGYRRYAAYQKAQGIAGTPFLGSVAPFALNAVGTMLRDPRFSRMAGTVEMLRKNPSRAYGEMFCGSYFDTARLRRTFAPEFLSRTESADAVGFVAKKMGGASDLDAAMRFDLASYLPDDLNVKMDRATMRWGLEARSPFLDQDLVAFSRTLPLSYKVRNGELKFILKKALKGVVPDEVLTRKKRGFQVPLAEWFRGPLLVNLRERCVGQGSPLLEIVQRESVERMIEENRRGADHGNRLWMLYALTTWMSIQSPLDKGGGGIAPVP